MTSVSALQAACKHTLRHGLQPHALQPTCSRLAAGRAERAAGPEGARLLCLSSPQAQPHGHAQASGQRPLPCTSPPGRQKRQLPSQHSCAGRPSNIAMHLACADESARPELINRSHMRLPARCHAAFPASSRRPPPRRRALVGSAPPPGASASWACPCAPSRRQRLTCQVHAHLCSATQAACIRPRLHGTLKESTHGPAVAAADTAGPALIFNPASCLS